MKQSIDLLSILITGIICVAIIIMPTSPAIVNAVAALLMVFVLPGYALRCLLFTTIQLDIAESLTFTVGLSLTVTIVGAFVLHYSPWGLQMMSWVMLLGGLTISTSGFAITRRLLLRNMNALYSSRPDIKLDQLLLISFAIMLIIVAYWNSVVSATNQPYDEFTQFWMVEGEENTVEVGLKNFEARSQDYNIVMSIDSRIVYQSDGMQVPQQEMWTIQLSINELRDAGRLTATLYKNGDLSTPYRQTWLYVNN